MATCYHPNGTAVQDTSQRPCTVPPGQNHGMCCATANRVSADLCTKGSNYQPAGFCLNPGDGVLYRDGCTDPNWGPDCLNVCTTGQGDRGNGLTGNLADNDWAVTACGDGTYCCGENQIGTTCCQEGYGFYIVNNTQTNQKPAGLSNYGSTITILATATAAPKNNQGGAIAGGTVGGFVVGAFLSFLIFFFYHRASSRRQAVRNEEIAMYEKVDPPVESGGHQAMVFEAPGDWRAAELGGSAPERPKSKPT